MAIARLGSVRALITTSRMPCAIDEVRKLGQQNHFVVATDTFRTAPGSHSRYVAKAKLTVSPRYETSRFVSEIGNIVRSESIDMVLPAFEEVFYLAKLRAELPPCEYFFPHFEVLERLHDKAKLLEVAREVGVRVPQTTVVRSRAELAESVGKLEHFFAKPVFSRGGVDLFTNWGPLAGTVELAQCEPTAAQPWIVQEFVNGKDVCTFSIAQGGRLTGHVAYVHPREIEHAGGIVFESIDDPEALDICQRIAELLHYHGQVPFDFMRTPRGLVLIECNPRPTAGVHLMSPEMFEQALLDKSGSRLRVAEAGVQRKYGVALVRDMLLHAREAREDARYLFSGIPDAIADADDLLPALYQVLSYGRVFTYRRQHGGGAGARRSTTLMSAYFDDVCWNGDPIVDSADQPSE
jgi:predicted ATP-grasp superfamily ATP-dependent carboligase